MFVTRSDQRFANGCGVSEKQNAKQKWNQERSLRVLFLNAVGRRALKTAKSKAPGIVQRTDRGLTATIRICDELHNRTVSIQAFLIQP